MKVYIMRGLPGSGKSTWPEKHLPGPYTICSADSFHMVKGSYVYKPENAESAHNRCLKLYIEEIMDAVQFPTTIVVDNTNTTVAELTPYVRVAQAFGVDVEIVYLHCDLATAIRRNIHNVPATTIIAMRANLLTEKLPFGWKQMVVL